MSGPVPNESPAVVKAAGRRKWNPRVRDTVSAYLYISPFFILFGVFGLFPVIFTAYISFHRWNILGEKDWIGWNNYSALMKDPLFWKSIGNTFSIWFLSTVPMLFMALVLAFLLNQAFLKGKDFFRLSVFMPNVTSVVAVAIIFSAIFGRNYGIINYLLTGIGLEPVDWQGTYWGTHVAIAAMVIWRWTGYNTIIYVAGLQGIPKDLYEAATIDGASKIQQFFKVTIPLMRPIIIFTVILSTIGGMQLFAEPLVFGTGSQNQGLTITLYLYNEAFQRFSFGYAASIAWMLFIIIVAFALINLFITQRIRSV